ncbi:MAG: hypothetical protein JSS81_15975 [Acidobacteria bacterium]|nr:hypothetical protein [Acidobacteriota bacterium]
MKNLLPVIVLLISASAVFALPGDLDTTFGVSGGYEVSDFFGLQAAETVNDVVVQPDGKIVIAGNVTSAFASPDFMVARYNADGTLDPTFSGDGIFTLNQGADEVKAIVLQADGKIVAVGKHGSFASNFVFRLLSNGTLDPTFGGGTGKVQVTAGQALSVVIQPNDGKIVIGGLDNPSAATLCRLNPDGSLDTTFDTDGIAVYPQLIQANGVAVQTDGRIVFTGSFSDAATARVLSNGALDTSFDGDGIAITSAYAADNEGDAVLIQPDGKILVAGGGGGGVGLGNQALLIRYNSNGSLDTSFDGDGIRLQQLNGNGENYYNDAELQPDGKILAIGTITYSLLNTLIRDSFTLARFNADGSPDASFDGNGIAKSQWCENASGMFLQSDGKIVAVGSENADSNRGTCTQRFNADGSVDATFNPNAPNGKVTQNFVQIEAVAGLPNGKIMAAGWDTGQYDIATLMRLNADGSLDTTFADEGVYQYFNGLATSTRFYALKALSGGGFLVAGEGGASPGAIIIKFDPAGNPDPTFSGDGIATSINAGRFYAIAIQSDGKIFGCGSSGFGASTRTGRSVRFSTTGTAETSVSNLFNTSGLTDSEVLGCAFQSDGKLIVAGYRSDGTSDALAISRHTTSLAIDTAFGSGGYVINDMSPALDDRATDLVIQPDNKIVVGSTGLGGGGDRDFAVLRYDANGVLDQNLVDNFGTGGISLINFGLGNPNDEAQALLLQPDGQLIAGGASDAGAGERFALVKINTGGAAAVAFGVLGRVLTPFASGDSRVTALSFYGNNKILAAGRAWNGADYDFAIARYQNEFIPTAAGVSVEGRVLTAKGGVANVVVTLTDPRGGVRTARTNSFGFYRFGELTVGETYVIAAFSKRFSFAEPARVLTLKDSLADVDFVANE